MDFTPALLDDLRNLKRKREFAALESLPDLFVEDKLRFRMAFALAMLGTMAPRTWYSRSEFAIAARHLFGGVPKAEIDWLTNYLVISGALLLRDGRLKVANKDVVDALVLYLDAALYEEEEEELPF